jgi:membrane protein CcdC involved in cytochrome C biogenesis
MDQKQMIGAAVIGIAVVAVVALRLTRMLRPQPLDPSRMWVLPGVLAALSVYLVSRLTSPSPTFFAFLVGAVVIGGGLGWLRAKTIRLSLDAGGRIIAQGSAAAVIFLVALIVVRILLRWAVISRAVTLPLAPHEFDAIFLVLAASLFVARTAEMAIRARQLLGARPA